MTARWVAALLRRRVGNLAATAAGVAIAIALLASIGSFVASSKASMTTRSAASVPVDWQVQVQPGADPAAVLSTVRATPGLRAALPVGFAATAGLQATTGGSTQTTGPGVAVGLPPGYATTFPGELRLLAGNLGGVLVAQQTASNLRVAPGDTVTVTLPGGGRSDVTVGGVVDLPKADTLFQTVGAPAGSQPTAPPDNIVLLPLADWQQLTAPVAAAGSGRVTMQVHALITRHLPSDPAAAYGAVNAMAANLGLRLAGTGVVGDNLATVLGAARGDALYAQVLFLFLGTPGAVVAGLLTAVVAGAAAARRRKEQSLLRARGATVPRLVGLAAAEALVVWVVAVVAGLAAAAAIGAATFGSTSFGATTASAVGWGAGAALVGLLIALLSVVLPAYRSARSLTVVAGRQELGRSRSPLWARLGVDVWLLAAAGLIFYLTGRTGYQLVLAPDGAPSISVSYWAYGAPLLLWLGAGLLTWRGARLLLGRGAPLLRALLRPFTGTLAPSATSSLGRQSPLVARAVVLVGLTIAFAGSTAVFDSTYRQQSEVDARLTNGGDVTVTVPPTAPRPELTSALARVPGVASVEPLSHRFAYVGPDLQDLYGVRPSTVVGATSLQDAYFQGASASTLIGRLRSRPDGILVSAETVKDFQLSPGDLLRLRLPDPRGGAPVTVAFHYVGIVKEFPTAPKDSFLVANASYVAAATGAAGTDEWLLRTSGASPATVASRVTPVAGATATVTDLTSARRVVGSSLTAVDLSGLTRVELGFAVVLAAAATGLVLALGLAERRRSFAIATALGARRRQLASLAWSEVGVVAVVGIGAGAVTGTALSVVLVKVLTGVFDPPPAALAVPWVYLAGLVAAALAAAAAAGGAAVRLGRRRPLEVLREL